MEKIWFPSCDEQFPRCHSAVCFKKCCKRILDISWSTHINHPIMFLKEIMSIKCQDMPMQTHMVWLNNYLTFHRSTINHIMPQTNIGSLIMQQLILSIQICFHNRLPLLLGKSSSWKLWRENDNYIYFIRERFLLLKFFKKVHWNKRYHHLKLMLI